MRCWIKIAAAVVLIGLLGVDIGLQTERYFGTPPAAAIQVHADVAGASKWTDKAQAYSLSLLTHSTPKALLAPRMMSDSGRVTG